MKDELFYFNAKYSITKYFSTIKKYYEIHSTILCRENSVEIWLEDFVDCEFNVRGQYTGKGDMLVYLLMLQRIHTFDKGDRISMSLH